MIYFSAPRCRGAASTMEVRISHKVTGSSAIAEGSVDAQSVEILSTASRLYEKIAFE